MYILYKKMKLGDREAIHPTGSPVKQVEVVKDFIENAVMAMIAKHTRDTFVCSFGLIHPSDWKKYKYIVHYVFMGSNEQINQIQLRRIDQQYVFFHDQTGQEEPPTYMRYDFLTWLLLRSLLVIHDDKETVSEILKQFVDDTGFVVPQSRQRDYIPDEEVEPKLTTMTVLLYALFVDQEPWRYIKETDSGDAENEYGFYKSVRIGNKSSKEIYFKKKKSLKSDGFRVPTIYTKMF